LVQRHFLSGKDRKLIRAKASKLSKDLADMFDRASRVEVIKAKLPRLKVNVYLADGVPLVVEDSRGLLYPTLHGLRRGIHYPFKVFVDDGAIRHIISGADVMVPGITNVVGDFKQEDIVAVYTESGNIPIALCLALMSGDKIRSSKKGRALKNIHHVGDALWHLINEFLPRSYDL